MYHSNSPLKIFSSYWTTAKYICLKAFVQIKQEVKIRMMYRDVPPYGNLKIHLDSRDKHIKEIESRQVKMDLSVTMSIWVISNPLDIWPIHS